MGKNNDDNEDVNEPGNRKEGQRNDDFPSIYGSSVQQGSLMKDPKKNGGKQSVTPRLHTAALFKETKEKEKLEKEKLEKEKEKLEKDKLEKEKVEKEKVEKEKERAQKEKIEREQAEKEKERIEREKER